MGQHNQDRNRDYVCKKELNLKRAVKYLFGVSFSHQNLFYQQTHLKHKTMTKLEYYGIFSVKICYASRIISSRTKGDR
ncbi:hypothetical protein EMIT07CA2_60194 [Brevibacillus sp. IT-7CA2]